MVVRDLEADVKTRLQRRAKQHGRSMEAEVRHILQQVVTTEDRSVRKLGSKITERFRANGLTDDLPELRGHAAEPADFGK